MLSNFQKRKEVGCPASLALLFMWVPSCFTDQDPFKRSGYSVTLVSKEVRCGWPPLPDVLAASCSAPGSQFSVVLLCAVSKRNGDVCILCFRCCFWLTACCRLREPNTTNIFLRWWLSRISTKLMLKVGGISHWPLERTWLDLINSRCLVTIPSLLEHLTF